MMKKNIADILAGCLEEIAAGTATIEECLDRHEDIRGELEPLLRLGLDIEELPRVPPSNAFKATTKAVLMEHIHNEQVSQKKHFFNFGGFLRPVWLRALAVVLVAIVVLSGAGAGTVFAANDSLPGETLYTVKTGWEGVRDWLQTDNAASAALQMEFAGRRLEEMARLLEIDPERLSEAVSGYELNLQKALDDADAAGNIGPLESVAIGITSQMAHMDNLEDISGDIQDLEQVREAAMNRQMTALRNLAGFNAVTAGKLTVAVMDQRMQRAAGANAHGYMRRTEQALHQFMKYAELGEEIRANAGEQGAALDEIYANASQKLQDSFAGFAGNVPPQLAGEIENSFRLMRQYRYGRMQQPDQGSRQPGGQGMGPGSHDQGPGMQEQVETTGEIAGNTVVAAEETEQPSTQQNGEMTGQAEKPGTTATVTPAQQPAGPEQEQGPGQVSQSPGQGAGNNGDSAPSGSPQDNHS